MKLQKLTATYGCSAQRCFAATALTLLVAFVLLGNFAFAQRATGTLRGQASIHKAPWSRMRKSPSPTKEPASRRRCKQPQPEPGTCQA